MVIPLLQLLYVSVAVQENVITQRVMETLAANSQQPLEELVHEVMALEARRANLEATLTRMGSVEDPRPRPIQPEVPRQKVLILDLNGLLLRLCKGVAEAERAREFGHLPVSPVGSRMVYVPRVGVSSFLAEVATDFTLIIWTSRTSRNTHLLLKDMEERGFMPRRFFQTHVSRHFDV
ncbi:hypothetical protein R1flu_016088 [Riccia fluitans]|uniref:FCP1 homology domain-containing protein n=1 Tax=Riccia fluitans TaxID=41844 RepID=A0ABD1YPP4_9MARC